MPSPPGERPAAAPFRRAQGTVGATGSEARRRPVAAGGGERIPPQTTVTVAPENDALPAAGRAGDRSPLDGSVRPASPVRAAPVEVLMGAGSQPDPAGVVTRLLAAGVDAVAVVVLAALLDLGAAGARFLWSPVAFRWPQPATSVVVAVLLVVAVMYLAVGWALAGRTYGSKLMGLRVLSSRHELLGSTRSVLRALLCVLWPVGLLWCGISRTRRSVADLVVRTVVVYDDRPYAGVRHGS